MSITFHWAKDYGVDISPVIAIIDGDFTRSIGGCRYSYYNNFQEMSFEASNLAQAMQNKLQFLGLPFNGAKAVLQKLLQQSEISLFTQMGEFINKLAGKYITGCDIGTSFTHMRIYAKQNSIHSRSPSR